MTNKPEIQRKTVLFCPECGTSNTLDDIQYGLCENTLNYNCGECSTCILTRESQEKTGEVEQVINPTKLVIENIEIWQKFYLDLMRKQQQKYFPYK